jgi:hypothetical protein
LPPSGLKKAELEKKISLRKKGVEKQQNERDGGKG